MMKKVLIIGGAGFIGYHLVEKLSRSKNYAITIADNFFRGKRDEMLDPLIETNNIIVVENDFTKAEAFDALDDDYDYVYMLASVVGVDYTTSIPNELIRINAFLRLNTLEWLKRSKCKKVLYSSTSECYAGSISAFNYPIPTAEDVPLCIDDIGHPRWTYAVTKMMGESGFLNYSRVFGFEATIVRYHNVFGPRMGFKHVIPHLVQRFREGENPFKVYGHDQTRTFNYISDAVNGTILAMEKPDTNGEIFHIGSEDEITIETLIKTVGEMMGFEGDYMNAPTYPGSVARRCPDITKARRLLGYEPETSWKDGLLITVDWYDSYINQGKVIYE
jgi:nucleoside-diphosphate-sugar epimerase